MNINLENTYNYLLGTNYRLNKDKLITFTRWGPTDDFMKILPCPQLPCAIVHYSMLTINSATEHVNRYNATQKQNRRTLLITKDYSNVIREN